MDVIQVERDFTAWVARLLGREVDADIFRGCFPVGVANSVGVALGSRIQDNYPGLDIWNVQVLGKFTERDAALAMMHQIASEVPCYGVLSGDTVFVSITSRGTGEPYSAADAGQIKWWGSVNLVIAVR